MKKISAAGRFERFQILNYIFKKMFAGRKFRGENISCVFLRILLKGRTDVGELSNFEFSRAGNFHGQCLKNYFFFLDIVHVWSLKESRIENHRPVYGQTAKLKSR